MNGGDKILDRIKTDCDESIKKIEADANENCSQLLSDAQKQAEQTSAEIMNKATSKVNQIKASYKSRVELETRNAVLKKKRAEIDITVDKTLDYMINLDDKEYFDIIYKLCSKIGSTKGEMLFNSRDISRLPNDFAEKLKAMGMDVTVSKNTVDIDGGFVLKNGDIEENMSFCALISAKRDRIEDLIKRELFAE